jgi:hypothetical protein
MFPIKCLCLDKRKELWTNLKNECTSLGLQFQEFIVGDGSDTILDYKHIDVDVPRNTPFLHPVTKGHYNAFLSHKKMAQEAYDEHWEHVLFMEDDAYLIGDRLNLPEIHKIIASIPTWDIIYFGWWMSTPEDTSGDMKIYEKEFSKNNTVTIQPIPRKPFLSHEISGLHGVLINRDFLPNIFNANIGPIDSLINHNLDHINAFFVKPKIIHVHSTWSYCEESFVNRDAL